MKTNNTILSYIHKTPEKIGLAVAVAAATIGIGGSATVLATSGPERPTYTIEQPAPHVTFNSITNNPAYGDERNFLRLKESSAPNSAYSDETKIEPGKTYTAYVYYHNNASKTLNDEAHGFKGIANNTKMRIAMPGGLKAGERTGMTGYISADNAQPQSVYDNTFMTASSDVALRYVPGSATVSSRGGVAGQKLPDSLFNTGALLGYDSLNGKLPGCNEFSGYVTFQFTADQPNFTIKKQVSPKGASKWQDKIVAKVGEEVDYLISYQNTGSTQQNDVLIKDQLPSGISYIGGSTNLANSANPRGVKTDDGLTTTGLNVGAYAPKGTAYLKYSAKVGAAAEKCGVNELVNTATAITGNGKKSSSATVTIDTPCKPDECKPGVPKGDARCDACVPGEGQVVDENGNCVATPAALPTTGPAETILTILGIGALTAGFVYWYRSRQNLKKALAGGSIEHDEKAHDAPKLLKARTDTKAQDDKKDF